jgi:ribonuclease P protein component
VTERYGPRAGDEPVSPRLCPGQNTGRFRRRSRLLKHTDFDRVYRQGRRQFAASMTFFYLPQSQPQETAAGPRVGLTVGRSFGGAVARNRIKRRMREAIRFSLGELAGVPVDVVINPKRAAATADFSLLRAEVQQGFRAITEKLQRKQPSGPRAGGNQS